LILLVIQLNLSSTAAPVSNAHTYRLLIVKELVW
jgi:hypothetical protein